MIMVINGGGLEMVDKDQDGSWLEKRSPGQFKPFYWDQPRAMEK